MNNIKKFKNDVSDCIVSAMQPPHNLTVGNVASVLLGTAVSLFREQNETSQEEALTSTIEFLTNQKRRMN